MTVFKVGQTVTVINAKGNNRWGSELKGQIGEIAKIDDISVKLIHQEFTHGYAWFLFDEIVPEYVHKCTCVCTCKVELPALMMNPFTKTIIWATGRTQTGGFVGRRLDVDNVDDVVLRRQRNFSHLFEVMK